MWGDETTPGKPDKTEPDDAPFTEEEENEDEELTEEDEEEQARAELGEVCENCGAEFEESNGSAALCANCFSIAEDIGEKGHAPLSKHPVVLGD